LIFRMSGKGGPHGQHHGCRRYERLHVSIPIF
jgi:hypothetical protein